MMRTAETGASLIRRVASLAVVVFPCLVVGLSQNAFLRPLLSTTTTPTKDQLSAMASASSRQQRGSSKSIKAWRYWSNEMIQLVRTELESSLNVSSADVQALEELSFQLGVAADVGAMPSFDNQGARAGYAVNYFCRAQLMADLLFSTNNEGIRYMLGGDNDGSCRMSSLGGGPGYDFVAAALVASYRGEQQETAPTVIHGTIFDYEQGWEDLAAKMTDSLRSVVETAAHSCAFQTCDITLPLSHPINNKCRQEAKTTDIWFCSYCIAENVQKLRNVRYVFFNELFADAKMGAVFVFTETTHRLWPELCKVAGEHDFELSFPTRFQKEFGKRQMVLCKRQGATFGKEEKALCLLFERDNELHKRKLKNGVVRQSRKVRGAKQS